MPQDIFFLLLRFYVIYVGFSNANLFVVKQADYVIDQIGTDITNVQCLIKPKLWCLNIQRLSASVWINKHLSLIMPKIQWNNLLLNITLKVKSIRIISFHLSSFFVWVVTGLKGMCPQPPTKRIRSNWRPIYLVLHDLKNFFKWIIILKNLFKKHYIIVEFKRIF